jgi:hypothetical protein
MLLYTACVVGGCPVVELYHVQCVIGSCPVVEQDDEMVVIHDPKDSRRGCVRLTKAEWNDIKKNAPLVE